MGDMDQKIWTVLHELKDCHMIETLEETSAYLADKLQN